jgi:proline dehydrogenase
VESPARSPYPPPEIDFTDFETPLRDKTDAELRAANLVLVTIRKPWLMRAGKLAARVGLAIRLPGTVAALERTVFRQFCGGTELGQAVERAARLYRHGVGCILDYAVEGEDDEADFDAVTDEILAGVDAAIDRPEIAFVAVKLTGIARFPLLEKASAGDPLDEPERAELARVEARLDRIAERAGHGGTSVFVDAEHSWVQDAIDAIVERAMEAHNRERAVVQTTVQMYLTGGLDHLERLIATARRGGYRFGLKLVRGAYMELERERAAERGEDSPIQPDKAATDAAFDRGLTLCLENLDAVDVCAATHSIASNRHLVAEMARLGVEPSDPRVTSSQLLGMFDRVTFPLARGGYNALKYVPYGGVRDAFPYLLRRADENKSVADQLASELEAIRAELRRRGKRAL